MAVWVENKDGMAVRNLALWVSHGGPGPFQWLPDLKRWYRSDQAAAAVDKTDMVLTISRPTRPPGKYSVIWDGKDDHGKPLARGEYTIFIDAAREHGTYQSHPQAGDASPPRRSPRNSRAMSRSNPPSIEYRRKSPAK